MTLLKEFGIAKRGVATTFSDATTPEDYSLEFRNLYYDAGNAEARQGLKTFSQVPTSNTISNLHEFITSTGTTILFASGGGRIWRYAEALDTWTLAYSFPNANSSAPTIYSYSMNGRIIFYDGKNRSFFTQDGITFLQHRSILEAGRGTVGTSAASLRDSTVLNWITTDVTENDLVHYTSLSAFALVTSVASAAVTHTPVSGMATGLGLTNNSNEPITNSPYEIIDLIELNIIPVSGQREPDNVGTLLTANTTTSGAAIGLLLDHSTTEARLGDIIYNKTRNRVAEITSIVTASFGHTSIATQVAGDEVRLLKSSMPITKDAQVHYSRAYLIDAREPHKVRISGPNNPQDYGSQEAATLDITTLQTVADTIIALQSYQRFLIVGGKKNIFIFEGTTPVATSTDIKDFEILGSFPVGILSRDALKTVGNEAVFVTGTGIQSTTLRKTTSQLEKKQASAQLDKTLRSLLKLIPPEDIIAFHYPRRSWLCVKLGTEIYVYNYAGAAGGKKAEGGGVNLDIRSTDISWHIFEGAFAQQRCYLLRGDGDLITGDIQGLINVFDKGVYRDKGSNIDLLYTTAWNKVTTGRSRTLSTLSRKKGVYIVPFFETGTKIPVTIKAEAPFEGYSTDTVIVTAGESDALGLAEIGVWEIGGNRTSNPKVPLRWNGEEVRISFEASISAGPFTQSNFILGYTEGDVK